MNAAEYLTAYRATADTDPIFGPIIDARALELAVRDLFVERAETAHDAGIPWEYLGRAAALTGHAVQNRVLAARVRRATS